MNGSSASDVDAIEAMEPKQCSQAPSVGGGLLEHSATATFIPEKYLG